MKARRNLDAVGCRQHRISGPLWYAGRLLLIALPMLALTYAIFGDAWAPTLPSLPLTFTILPFVIWTALRFGWREVTALNALVCIIAVWHTIEGRGPFASAPLGTSLLLLLAFMGTVVFTGLVLNTVVGERGRAFGVSVPTETATLLNRHTRGTDIACRYGGEEFTLVLPNATLQSARHRAEAICAAIREEGVLLMGVTASLGVAIFPDHAADP